MISFRQDNYTEATLATLDGIISANTHVQWHAMIDHLFLPKLGKKLQGNFEPWVSLYDGLSGAEDSISPLLLTLSADPQRRRNQLALLLKTCNGLPMLSFWASGLPVPGLQAHFSQYYEARLQPDDTVVVLRYADTRCLPNLLGHLDAQQRQEILAPFVQLVTIDATAKPQVINGSNLGRIGAGALSLDEAQWSAMLEDSLPDYLFDQIASHQPQSSPSQVYQWLKQRLEAGRAAGLKDDRLHDYCLETET